MFEDARAHTHTHTQKYLRVNGTREKMYARHADRMASDAGVAAANFEFKNFTIVGDDATAEAAHESAHRLAYDLTDTHAIAEETDVRHWHGDAYAPHANERRTGLAEATWRSDQANVADEFPFFVDSDLGAETRPFTRADYVVRHDDATHAKLLGDGEILAKNIAFEHHRDAAVEALKSFLSRSARIHGRIKRAHRIALPRRDVAVLVRFFQCL